jgi:hypothetical protein
MAAVAELLKEIPMGWCICGQLSLLFWCICGALADDSQVERRSAEEVINVLAWREAGMRS